MVFSCKTNPIKKKRSDYKTETINTTKRVNTFMINMSNGCAMNMTIIKIYLFIIFDKMTIIYLVKAPFFQVY